MGALGPLGSFALVSIGAGLLLALGLLEYRYQRDRGERVEAAERDRRDGERRRRERDAAARAARRGPGASPRSVYAVEGARTGQLSRAGEKSSRDAADHDSVGPGLVLLNSDLAGVDDTPPTSHSSGRDHGRADPTSSEDHHHHHYDHGGGHSHDGGAAQSYDSGSSCSGTSDSGSSSGAGSD